MAAAPSLEDPGWDHWLALAWPTLLAGRRLRVPGWLAHPSSVGFTRPAIAEPAGQSADFVRPLDDGSRLHVHAFGPRLVVHRDRIDPSRGPVAALHHWTAEATSARAVAAVLLAWALSRAGRR
jgi:hypothetical protein